MATYTDNQLNETNASPNFTERAALSRQSEIGLTLVGVPGDLGEIKFLMPEAIAKMQQQLKHGHTFGTWSTPREWHPHAATGMLSIDLRARIAHFVSQILKDKSEVADFNSPVSSIHALAEEGVLAVSRYLLLCRRGPAKIGRGSNALDVTTIATLAHWGITKLAAMGIANRLLAGNIPKIGYKHSGKSTHIFESVSASTVQALGFSASVENVFIGELRRLEKFVELGLWLDAPVKTNFSSVTTSVSDTALIGVAGEKVSAPRKIEKHLPLPDDYTSELGWKCQWLALNVGPSLLRLLRKLVVLWGGAYERGASAGNLAKSAAVQIAAFDWQDEHKRMLPALPFPLRLTSHGQKRSKDNFEEDSVDACFEEMELEASEDAEELANFSWPPRNLAQVFGVARVVQGAHSVIAMLSLGNRNGELLSMRRGCVVQEGANGNRASFITFKFREAFDGTERQIPIADFVADVLKQQEGLVSCVEKLSVAHRLVHPDNIAPGEHLWGQVGGAKSRRTEPIRTGLGFLVYSLVDALGMDRKPSGKNITPHRFRKTIARICALALVNGARVLQEIFGHENIADTLYYILSDDEIRADAQTVARELRIMMSSRVIGDIVDEWLRDNNNTIDGMKVGEAIAQRFAGYGGLKAQELTETVKAEIAKVNSRGEDFSKMHVRELAEILTMKGETWNQVRPGIICTKELRQPSPCSKKRGNPEPANCSSECKNRLEDSMFRSDVDGNIAEAVEEYSRAKKDGKFLMSGMWAGQIRAHLTRFDDVREKWMRDPIVIEAVES